MEGSYHLGDGGLLHLQGSLDRGLLAYPQGHHKGTLPLLQNFHHAV